MRRGDASLKHGSCPAAGGRRRASGWRRHMAPAPPPPPWPRTSAVLHASPQLLKHFTEGDLRPLAAWPLVRGACGHLMSAGSSAGCTPVQPPLGRPGSSPAHGILQRSGEGTGTFELSGAPSIIHGPVRLIAHATACECGLVMHYNILICSTPCDH